MAESVYLYRLHYTAVGSKTTLSVGNFSDLEAGRAGNASRTGINAAGNVVAFIGPVKGLVPTASPL